MFPVSVFFFFYGYMLYPLSTFPEMCCRVLVVFSSTAISLANSFILSFRDMCIRKHHKCIWPSNVTNTYAFQTLSVQMLSWSECRCIVLFLFVSSWIVRVELKATFFVHHLQGQWHFSMPTCNDGKSNINKPCCGSVSSDTFTSFLWHISNAISQY